MDKLEEGSRARDRWPRPAPDADTLELEAGKRTYRIPVDHLRERACAPALQTHPEVPALELDLEALLQLARTIDRNLERGPSYEAIAIDAFARQLETEEGGVVSTLHAGRTQLAVAPTGTGKSVFTRLAALHFASQGHPVALVVPGVSTVWSQCIQLEDAIRAVDLKLEVAPLSSSAKVGERLQQHLAQPSDEDTDGRWALRRVGYVCNLGAYVNRPEQAPPLGEEPCKRLRRLDDPSRRSVTCPFSTGCGRFTPFERATSADIIVINHGALSMGRVPIPVRVDGVDGGHPRTISMAELVLRRCPVVFIDEIDRLQASMIDNFSDGLALGSTGQHSLPYRLLYEVEGRRANQTLSVAHRFERGRSALMLIAHEAERLAEVINRGEMRWPSGRHMLWRDALDAQIAGPLFGDDPGAFDKVRNLFKRGDPFLEPVHEAIHQVLVELAGPGLGDGRRHREVRAQLMAALAGWRFLRGEDSPRGRDRLIDRLIVRAALGQLDRALRHIRLQLPGLESEGILEASQMRERLLGYTPWSPSPLGALGKRLFGYSFTGTPDTPGVVETRAFAGDPHGVIADYGDVVARALCGAERIVVGLSATCRFPGSPRANVLGPLLGFVPDRYRNVRIEGSSVSIRVSGVSRDRPAQARAAAMELLDGQLGDYLRERVADPETADRARALVVTNSYVEATAAALGLCEATRRMGRDIEIWRVARDSDDGGPATLLPPSRIPEFGAATAPAILVSPLHLVARGHNILQQNSPRSAIAGIFVLVRPLPPAHRPESYLAHLSYHARLRPTTWKGDVNTTLVAERNRAWAHLRTLQMSSPLFGRMDPELRRELVCNVLVELAQLAGRARRGGTSVELFFVDQAFEDLLAPWPKLIFEILQWWHDQGLLSAMASMHGAFVYALANYAGFPLPATST